MFKFTTTLALYAFLYQGFATALSKAMAVSLPVAPQTIAIAFFAPATLFLSIAIKKLNKTDVYILLATSGLILAKALGSEMVGLQVDYTSAFWYLMFCFLFVALRNKNPLGIAEVTRAIYGFGIVSASVATAQVFGSEALPSYLIEPPFTREDLLTTIYSYDLIDQILNRPNGLFSNPIVYAAFLIVIFEIALLRLRQKYSLWTLLIILFISSTIFTSLSRAAIFGLLYVSLAYVLKSKRIFLLAALMLLGAFVYIQTSENSSLAFEILSRVNERFAGIDAFAQASNAEHLSDKEMALQAIIESPLIGYSFGFFSREDIITDGAAFILALEFGVPITIFLFALVILRANTIANDSRCRPDFPVYSIYFFMLSALINSSLIDKAIVPILIILLTIQTYRYPTQKPII